MYQEQKRLVSTIKTVHGQDTECIFAEGQESEAKKPNGHNAKRTKRYNVKQT